jgi:hypothetical protein
VEPAGLVTIAAHAERVKAQGHQIKLLAPADPNRARYLSRMGIREVMEELGVEHDLPPVRRHAEAERSLVELSRFQGTSGAEAIAEMVFDRLYRNDLVAAKAMHKAICELGTNVPEHAGVDGGFLAAQVTHNGSQIRFAVADSGAGLRSHMNQVGARTDHEALRLALTKRVTTTGSVHRGKGLARVLELVKANRGYLHVSSGRAGVTLFDGWDQPKDYAERLRGTMIQGMVKCDSP